MELNSQIVFDAALRLPDEDRARLAQELLDSLPDDPSLMEDWSNELRRRSDEVDQGTADLVPWSDLKRER